MYDKIIERIEDYENAKERGLIIRKYEKKKRVTEYK